MPTKEQTLWEKPAEEVGLKLQVQPLLGRAYIATVHGMLTNTEFDFRVGYIVRWRDTQVWRAELLMGINTGIHVHYQFRVSAAPEIKHFSVECYRLVEISEPRVGLCKFRFDTIWADYYLDDDDDD